jgi:protease-4
MFRIGLAVLLLSGVGCSRFLIRTDNDVRIQGPVETKVTADIPPVADAGPVRGVPVRAGTGADAVAIVDVDGLILNTPFTGPMSVGENPVALFREKLDAVEADPHVKAVVLRVNSPGGGVAATGAMRRDLERFKARSGKPVVACVLDQACGGAFVLATAADVVVADPAAVVGGVGVILNLFNLRDLMAQFNVVPQSVKAGEKTDLGSSARALTPEDKKILQDMADELHAELIATVRKARPRVDPATGTTFDGRVFTAKQALARGLVDAVGDLDEAIRLAEDRAGCASGTAGVVMLRRKNDPARSVYAVTPNVPLQGAGLLPNVPGLDRSKLPTFLSLWQPELTMEKLGGK